MIAYAQKHSFGHQNHVSRMPRSWVGISLLEVLLDLLQPLHPVCGLHVNLRPLKMISNDWGQNVDTRTMFLTFHSLKGFLTSYSPSTLFMAFMSIWGLWKWSQMISHSKKHGAQQQNDVSMQPAEAIVRTCHWEAWFFLNIFWPPQKKSWNRQKIQKRSALYYYSFKSC